MTKKKKRTRKKKKKKTMALKSFTQDEDEEDEEVGDSELEDYALLSKKYKKYLRLKKENNSKPNFKSNDHTTNKYSMKGKSKKKAMKATWDDSSENESDEKSQEEISNMFFIAIDDEVKSLELNDKSSDDEFNEKLIFKNGALKKKKNF